MESKNYVIGVSGTISLFEGFKTGSRIQKAKLEIERLRLEKEKGIAEVMNRHKKIEETERSLATELRNRQEIVAKGEENLSMVRRLAEQKAVEYADLLNRKIELLNDKWEITRTKITRRSALLELQIFSEAMN
jgi:outer membrane protein TolC